VSCKRFFPLPLRVRLTLWYSFAVGLLFLLLAIFLYVQVQRSLIGQMDAALELDGYIGGAGGDRLPVGGGEPVSCKR
jgi:hypothetical protein